jgi:putative ABC transport system ATP-binding protein
VTPVSNTSRTDIAVTAAAARGEALRKVYGEGEAQVVALDSVDVEFGKGRFTAIMGPSGSGKSTLMHCMAGLDTLSSGRAWIGDTELSALDDKRLTALRRDKVGFVFQSFNLLPTLTGGQQQRVACARALASSPEIIFADEPTGNLDSRSGADVLGFLRSSVREMGQTIVMVTHDASAASYADRVLFLADGRVVDQMSDPTAELVLERMKAFDATGNPVPEA